MQNLQNRMMNHLNIFSNEIGSRPVGTNAITLHWFVVLLSLWIRGS